MKYILFLGTILIIISCKFKKITNETAHIEKSIDSLIQLMTLKEKIAMIHASSSFTSGGVERLGIPELVMSDGPHGVRHEQGRDWSTDKTDDDFVTYLPTGIALASTWNRELGYQYGKVLGNEAKARGKDIILGPAINIIRSPLCGRNFEYLSEDPYLASEMAIGYIKGVQEQQVAACAKHYVANNQETDRLNVNVNISERALREIYLPAFKASVQKADVYSIMGAYNKIWEQYCSHNDYMVNNILKKEYGFSGFLVSDWGAVHDTREALIYGTDIEMGTDLSMLPEPDYNKFYLADSALAMVEKRIIDEKFVNEKIRRILRIMYKTNHFNEKTPGKLNTPEHQNLALKVAEEAIVLLKNDNILPIDNNKEQTIAIIGHNANRKFAEKGGSSQVKALYEVTPLEGIRKLAGTVTKIIYAEGYVPSLDNSVDEKLAFDAIEIAKNADAVIFIGGWIHNYGENMWDGNSYDCEGNDKENLKLMYGQEILINEIAKVNPNLAVVIMGGSNAEMKGWMNNARAIIQAWYPGMEGGTALAKIIFGKTNPSGKLPMTFTNSHLEYPSHVLGEFPGKDLNVNYSEDIFVGYRYFATKGIETLFPFGHGLSYTCFEYNNLQVKKQKDKILITCQVTNTGEMAGSEVVQLYVHARNSKIERSSIELKEFEKVNLEKGETKQVNLFLSNDSFKYFNETDKKWILEPGIYEIQLGSSSSDIRLKNEIQL